MPLLVCMIPDLTTSLNAAKSLLGWTLIHHTPLGDIGGVIIETEAYSQEDEASHTFRGRTNRNAPMFEEAGTIYMYFIYGMHWCMNIVTGPKEHGEAALIRALYPTHGIELMHKYRKTSDFERLTNGPGSLVQALDIPPSYNGKKIDKTNLELLKPDIKALGIIVSPRVGIKKAADKLWRFRLSNYS